MIFGQNTGQNFENDSFLEEETCKKFYWRGWCNCGSGVVGALVSVVWKMYLRGGRARVSGVSGFVGVFAQEACQHGWHVWRTCADTVLMWVVWVTCLCR